MKAFISCLPGPAEDFLTALQSCSLQLALVQLAMRTVSADDGDVLRLARQRATADRATARSKALGQQKRSASLTDLVGLNQSNAPEDSDTEPLSRTCDVSDVQTQVLLPLQT